MNMFFTVVNSMALVSFLFLGVIWGESLLAEEWVTRVDYLIIFFSGGAASMCLWCVLDLLKVN